LEVILAFSKDYGADFAAELMGALEASMVECEAEMATALSARDADALGKSAHKLKGGLRNLGATTAADVADEVEHLGRAGTLVSPQRIKDLFAASRTFVHAWAAVSSSADPSD
jgi:HPt (histidine-containing phosphotransfer) domain-containing protein